MRKTAKKPSREDVYRRACEKTLREEAHKMLNIFHGREDSLTKRLQSLETAAMPFHALEEIKTEIRRLSYNISKNTKSNDELLRFFKKT